MTLGEFRQSLIATEPAVVQEFGNSKRHSFPLATLTTREQMIYGTEVPSVGAELELDCRFQISSTETTGFPECLPVAGVSELMQGSMTIRTYHNRLYPPKQRKQKTTKKTK